MKLKAYLALVQMRCIFSSFVVLYTAKYTSFKECCCICLESFCCYTVPKWGGDRA